MKIPALLSLIWLLLLSAAALAQEYKPTGVAPARETFLFGVHPYANPQDLFAAYQPVVAYLESRIPGARFEVEASRDYADYEAKLAARRFHFALPNPAQTVAVLGHGYRVIAKMTPDDDFAGLMVARADRPIAGVADLAGRELCFPSPTALAATLLPLLYLHDHGLPAKELKIRYVGSQFSSIVNAYSGEFAACGSTSRFWRTWARENPDKAREMKVLWRTPSLPHNAVVARDDVPAALAQQVAQVLSGMDKDPQLDPSQFTIDQNHFEPATDATYQPVREFLERYDQAIGVPVSMKPGQK